MTNQLLTFTLNDSLYAIEVFKVQEVLVYTEPTKIPCAASYIKGLINSRDQGISVVDLRKRFDLPDCEPSKDSRIIVLEIPRPTAENPEHTCLFGAITDSVQEVLEVEEEDIAPPPKFGNSISANFISGLTKKDDQFIIILDVQKIFEKTESLAAASSSEE